MYILYGAHAAHTFNAIDTDRSDSEIVCIRVDFSWHEWRHMRVLHTENRTIQIVDLVTLRESKLRTTTPHANIFNVADYFRFQINHQTNEHRCHGNGLRFGRCFTPISIIH